MSTNALTTCLFSLPCIAVILHILIRVPSCTRIYLQLILSGLLVILSLVLMFSYTTIVTIDVASWPAPFGIALVMDQLSVLLIMVFSMVFLCINFYALNDHELDTRDGLFYIGSWLLMLGLFGALCTIDIFNLYVWSEVMLVSAFLILISTQRLNSQDVMIYALFNIIGTLILLLAIALIYGLTGHLNNVAIAQVLSPSHAAPYLMLLLIGLAFKGGLFPYYFWLPKAYPNTSTSATILLSSVVTKVMMVVLLRLIWLWPPLNAEPLHSILIIIACLTMFLGVMGAANQFDIKSILSFHIISQLGYILLAFAIPTKLAIMAGLIFLIHNIYIKTALFMVSGIAEQALNSRDLKSIGSILKACPELSVLFFISALSLAGFPPLSGFWGKFMVLSAAYQGQEYLGLSVAVLVSLFTLYSMLKIWRYGFCEPAAGSAVTKFNLNAIQRFAVIPLVLIPLIISIYPTLLEPVMRNISEELSAPQQLINTVLRGKHER